MEYCKECFTPSTRPRIQFSEGICNACWHSQNRKNNKINYLDRKNQFLNLIDNESCEIKDQKITIVLE